MRSLEEIQQAMITALAGANSPADDLSPGSVLSALIRSASTVILEQDNRLQDIRDTLDLTKMSGSYLDDYARAYFNLYRKPGTLAKGMVILSTNSNISLTVPRGTILTELNRGMQYITLQGPITVSPTADSVVEVISVSEGSMANLKYGTPLYITSSTDPSLLQVDAIVGYERLPDGSICGSFAGGSIQETDTAFRRRIAEFREGQGPTLQSSLNSFLPVSRSWITTLAPGFIRVYVDLDTPLTESFRNTLRERVEVFLPPGVAVSFENVTTRPIEIEVRVKAYPNTAPDLDIRRSLEDYFDSFQPGQTVQLEPITGLISSYVMWVQMSKPMRPIPLKSNQLPYLSDLSICYD